MATRWGEPPLPALMYKRGGCLALASEVSNNRASPHLASSALPYITYKYIAWGKMHAFHMLYQTAPHHQWLPCSHGPLRHQTALHHETAPRNCTVTERRHVTNGPFEHRVADWSILCVTYKMQFHREIWMISTLRWGNLASPHKSWGKPMVPE